MGTDSSAPAGRAFPRPARYLVLGGILLMLLGFGLKGWRLLQVTRSLQSWQADAEAMMAAGVDEIDPEAVEALIVGVRHDVLVLRTELGPILPLTRFLGWLPKVGSTVAAAPQLMEMADAGTEAAVYAFRGLKPGLVMMHSGDGQPDSSIADFVNLLASAEDDLANATASFRRLQSARAELGDSDLVPQRLQSLLEQADGYLPVAEGGLRLLQAAPGLLGTGGARRYLILIQNEDELRPTGGFVTGAGLLTLDGGNIVDVSFEDATLINDWTEKPYDLPPRPLRYFMGLELFLFRDANFWPDFPISAETAMALYAYGQEVGPLDGAIAIDQRFMELLLAALGPVRVSGYEEPIDSSNVVQRFQEARSFQGEDESGNLSEWFQLRKEFMGTFAAAILARVETGIGNVDPWSFAQNMWEAVQGKHLQIYVRDPGAAAALRSAGADGRVADPGGTDLLMVVDSNMGYNKANRLVDRRYSYAVDLSADGETQSELVVHYSHQGPPLDGPCRVEDGFLSEVVIDYSRMAQLCYWNYLRVYVPMGSRLREWSRHPVPAESILVKRNWDGDVVTANDLPWLSTFSNFLLVPASQELESWLKYSPPIRLLETDEGERRYDLLIVKQAGTRPESVKVRVTLPAGSAVVATQPAANAVEVNLVEYDIILDRDTLVSVTYR